MWWLVRGVILGLGLAVTLLFSFLIIEKGAPKRSISEAATPILTYSVPVLKTGGGGYTPGLTASFKLSRDWKQVEKKSSGLIFRSEKACQSLAVFAFTSYSEQGKSVQERGAQMIALMNGGRDMDKLINRKSSTSYDNGGQHSQKLEALLVWNLATMTVIKLVEVPAGVNPKEKGEGYYVLASQAFPLKGRKCKLVQIRRIHKTLPVLYGSLTLHSSG